jgi:ligand-binding sensor domain-containing protein
MTEKYFIDFQTSRAYCFKTTTDMVEDKSGNLWIHTANGFCKYDGKSFAHYINPEITWNELKAVLHNYDLSANTSFKIAKNNYSNLISNRTVHK